MLLLHYLLNFCHENGEDREICLENTMRETYIEVTLHKSVLVNRVKIFIQIKFVAFSSMTTQKQTQLDILHSSGTSLKCRTV